MLYVIGYRPRGTHEALFRNHATNDVVEEECCATVTYNVQEGDDAGQKLAAELLRVLVSQRQARLALRDAGGLETLMLCLTSSPPQVQQSAFDALKILWSSEDGALLRTVGECIVCLVLFSPPKRP